MRPRQKRSAIPEVFQARDQIVAYLSANGFSDIGEEDLIILLAVTEGLTPQIIFDLASEFNMTGEAIAQSSSRLLSRGYLELRREAGNLARTQISLTRLGIDIGNAIQHAACVKRWADFPARQGDIVISTVPKCGTTWLQMICALLIFQSPELPASLQRLSPWLESSGHTRDEVFAELSAQNHRRFIKTHMGLSEISMDSRVTYIVVGRHPLDAALSFLNAQSAPKDVRNDDPAANAAPAPRDALLKWIDRESTSKWKNRADAADYTLSGIMRQLSDSWQFRNEPNVLLVHYGKLSEDLEGEMRRIAAGLGIAVPESAWPGLVKAATFEEMRASADRLQPMPELVDPASFFHSGRSGRGSELLPGEALAHYRERMARLAPPDFVDWLHRRH